MAVFVGLKRLIGFPYLTIKLESLPLEKKAKQNNLESELINIGKQMTLKPNHFFSTNDFLAGINLRLKCICCFKFTLKCTCEDTF